MAKTYDIIGVDIGGTSIDVGVVRFLAKLGKGACSEAPQILKRLSVPTNASAGAESVLTALCDVMDEVSSGELAGFAGIGIGTRGHVALDGSIAWDDEALMPGWSATPLAALVTERMGLSCAVLNDVQAYATAEAAYGAARGAKSAVVVAVGTGLGGAFVLDGKVVRGSRGFASEFGHTSCVGAAGIPCSCGGVAHLESVASGGGMEARFRACTGRRLSGAQIAQQAAAGDAAAVRVVSEAGHALGEAVVSWVNMLDPDMVLLAGSVTKAGPVWEGALREALVPLQARPGGPVEVRGCQLGADAAIIGAAEYARQSLGLP